MARKPPAPPSLDIGRRQVASAAPVVLGESRLTGARAVPIEQLTPDPDQPRRAMDSGRLAELAASLTEHGVLQPLLVREDGYLEDGRTRYMIIAGGRRHAAAQRAGLTRLPVVVRDTEGASLRLTQLIENIQRQDLAPLEEARAFKELIDADGLSAETLGERLHISGQQIRERLRLLSDQGLADAVERGQITPSVARAVQRLPEGAQEPLRERIKAGEALPLATVQGVKERTAAAGIENTRAKGGGRHARNDGSDQAVLDPGTGRQDQAVLDPDPVRALYEAFKGWETQVSQLAAHDLQRLVGLIHGDMHNFIAIVTEMTANERDGDREAGRASTTL